MKQPIVHKYNFHVASFYDYYLSENLTLMSI